MNMNRIGRCAVAAALATGILLAAAPVCLAGSTGVAKLDQPGSGYHGYSTYVPSMMALVPGPDYSTSHWALDLALTWHPGE